MNRRLLLTVAAAAMLACGGCKPDYYAKKIVAPDCGALGKSLAGTHAFQLELKRIDKHVTIETPTRVPIDIWLIGARGKGGKPLPSREVSAPTVLLLHGLTETKWHYLPTGELVAKKGYNVVLMDLRGHGQSGGKYIGYGVVERDDVKYVMDRLIRQGEIGPEIYVFGVTLGAATAIHYAAVEPRVKGIMAMAPYRDAESIGRWRLALHSAVFHKNEEKYQDALARAGVLSGFDPPETSTVQAVKKIKCPLLLVHGVLDFGVPLAHSEEIFKAANEPKKFKVVTPGPEQLALGLNWNAWVANQMDKLIRTGLQPATTPIKKPTTKPVKKPPTKKPPAVKVPAPVVKPPVKKPPVVKPPVKKPPPVVKPPVKKPPATKPAVKKPPAPKPPVITVPAPALKPTITPAKKPPTTKPAPATKPAPKTKPAPPATMPAAKKAV